MDCLQSTPELAEVLECLFPSAKGTPDCKNYGKYNGDAQQCEIYVKNNIKIVG